MPVIGDRPESWPVRESQDLHRDDWIVALRADQVQRPGHPEEEPFRRLVVEHPGAAMVLAIDEDDRVLCLQQYRHAAQRALVELPAGLCDVDGEEPLAVAQRELCEEAELEAGQWSHLLSVWASPGITEEIHHLFLARGLTHASRGDFALHHEEAEMTVDWVPFDVLHSAVLAGRVNDGPVALAVLTARARGLA